MDKLSGMLPFLLSAINQAYLMYLGWEVTTNTSLLGDSAKLRWYRVLFITSSILGIGLAGIITANSMRVERAHFKITLQRIYPSIFSVNEKLGMNYVFNNVGTGLAFNVKQFARLTIQDEISAIGTTDATSKFYQALTMDDAPEGATIQKGEKPFNTARGPAVSLEDIDNLENGRKVLYLVGLIIFQDDFGKHTQRICYVLQPPPHKFIWQNCSNHFGELDGWVLKYPD